MKKTGSQILLECLQLEGVEKVFGYPGGAVINIYDDLFDSPIQHILNRHEQAAVHAADGYARATGKVGVERTVFERVAMLFPLSALTVK